MNALDTHFGQLLAVLLAWALAWLTAAFVAPYAGCGETWRHFWFMSGLWAAIDAGIAWYGLVAPPMPNADLAAILRLNAGLDVVYVLVGVALLTRRSPRMTGFGRAVVVQGLFLLALDVTFWLRVRETG
jgi:hypothetical protein